MRFTDDKIPTIFYSGLQGKPIENCVFCGEDVLHSNRVYVIEKIIKHGKSDSEYAVCMECASKMKGGMSEESEQNISQYFEHHSLLPIYRRFFQQEELDVNELLETCIVKGVSVQQMDEYQVAGIFRGDKLYAGALPFILSLEAIMEVNDLLSAKTKEEMDGYIDQINDLPPEWKEIFRTKKPVLI